MYNEGICGSLFLHKGGRFCDFAARRVWSLECSSDAVINSFGWNSGGMFCPLCPVTARSRWRTTSTEHLQNQSLYTGIWNLIYQRFRTKVMTWASLFEHSLHMNFDTFEASHLLLFTLFSWRECHSLDPALQLRRVPLYCLGQCGAWLVGGDEPQVLEPSGDMNSSSATNQINEMSHLPHI